MSRFHAVSHDLAVAESSLAAYRACLGTLAQLRAGTRLVADALAIAALSEELQAGERVQLARVRRLHGQRHAMTPGCRGDAPAVMAHGCAASSAVGPAPRAGQAGAATPNADPLLSGPEGQDLPPVSADGNTQSRVGGGHGHAKA